MTRFLVFSDLHLNRWLYGSSVLGGFNSRLLDQEKVLDQIGIYAKDNGISLCIFLGDLFHTSTVSSEVLEVAYRSFKKLSSQMDLVLLVGNHDQANKEGSIHSLSFFRPFATLVDKPCALGGLEGINMYASPYLEKQEDLIEFFSTIEDNSIAFIHQGVSGVPINSKGFVLNETFNPKMIPPKMKHVFAGHYHSHTRVNSQITIPGSPLQLTWGDLGEPRGWLDVSIGDEIIIHHVESLAPKFILNPKEKEIKGNFIRCTKEKEEFLNKGALSIEKVQIQEQLLLFSGYNLNTLNEIFEEYIVTKKLDESLIEVGREIWNLKPDS